jgi:DNA helicase-4
MDTNITTNNTAAPDKTLLDFDVLNSLCDKPEGLSLLIGQEITHTIYGDGVIADIDFKMNKPEFIIKFRDIQIKSFSIKLVSRLFSRLLISPSVKQGINYFLQSTQTIDTLIEQEKIAEVNNYITQLCEIYTIKYAENSLKKYQEDKEETIRILIQRDKYSEAEEIFHSIQSLLTNQERAILLSNLRQEKTRYLENNKKELVAALEKFDFNTAEIIYHTISESFPQDEYESLVKRYRKQQEEENHKQWVKTSILKIEDLLKEFDFEKANTLYQQIAADYPEQDYLVLYEKYQRLCRKQAFCLHLKGLLGNFQFQTAEMSWQETGLISLPEYEEMLVPYIQAYFEEKINQRLNAEQSRALAKRSPGLLIAARAGSGKTRVLASKAAFLVDRFQINPDHILVMAFNRSAADEIRNRIRRDYKQPGFESARTFHSLAHQLVRPTEDLLYDETDDVITRKMSLFVQQLLKEQIRNPVFIEKMYSFFRKEMREIERTGFFLDEEAYFDFRRNLLQVTLNGERVKSTGEKIIADYLFEHDISYGYEKVWLWGSQIYRPDFSIYEQQKDYVIEFWGIDENDPGKQVPPEWSQTWDEYYTEMQAKRAFWKEKSVVLIETSIQDLRKGREAFEEILKRKLAKAGIDKPKLTSIELIHKIRDKDYTITRLSELFTQFVQRAKKQALKAQDVQKLLHSYQPKDYREEVFLDLACRVYVEYEQALIRQRKIDFDDLMMRATEKVHETRGECAISLGNPKSRSFRMNDLRWILIDEYQDFSELFYRLITAIQTYNPQVQLFCVGDDWQAINGFAGSDLQFFDKFREWVKDGQVAHLLTNFRSQAAIVRTGNALMQGCGRPGEHLPQKNGGDVQIGYMDDVWIEFRNNDASAIQKTEDKRFLITEAALNGNDKKYNRIVASKYLKKCYQIITSPENQGKSVAILSRTNWIDGVKLSEFKNRLIASLTTADLKTIEDPKNKINVQTAHKYKGLEADLVIILGACNGAFPLLHPDNALFEIFGKTLLDAFEEERRLFYVALTRAKTSLYILTEKGRESVFLKRLPGYQPSQSVYSLPARSSQVASQFLNVDEENIPF